MTTWYTNKWYKLLVIEGQRPVRGCRPKSRLNAKLVLNKTLFKQTERDMYVYTEGGERSGAGSLKESSETEERAVNIRMVMQRTIGE